MVSEHKFLVKFFKNHEHADNFLKKGQLYMNSLDFFKKYSEDEIYNIRDSNEGVFEVFQADNISSLEVYKHHGSEKILTIPSGSLKGPVCISRDADRFRKIYCMTNLNFNIDFDEKDQRQRIDSIEADKLFDFSRVELGDVCVVIFDVYEFINRFRSSMSGMNPSAGDVIYYNFDNFNGVLYYPYYYKSDKYSHQKEYRLTAYVDDTVEHHVAYLGPLDDIGKVFEKSTLENEPFLIKINPPDQIS